MRFDRSVREPVRLRVYYGRCQMPGPKHLAENCTENAECASLRCESLSEFVRVCVPSQQSVVCSSSKVTPGTGTFRPPVPTGVAGAGGGTGVGGRSGVMPPPI